MVEHEFWARVATGDGCWEWTGALSSNGYGHLTRDGRTLKAHRYAYEQSVGPIPEGLYVLHSCDNRRCVRPDHLRVGTAAENVVDMDNHGRRVLTPQAGEQNHNARLTSEQVARIRGMADAGHYHDEIAALFRIDTANVSHIARRKTWRGIEPIAYPPAVRDRPLGRSAPRKKAARSGLP